MSENLMARMLAARESWVALDGLRAVRLRRPDQLQLLSLAQDGRVLMGTEMMVSQAVDWRGFSEADLVPGGASDVVPFDRELWRLWIGDREQHWTLLVTELSGMIEQARTEHETAEKK